MVNRGHQVCRLRVSGAGNFKLLFFCFAMLGLLLPRMLSASGTYPLMLRIPDVPGVSINMHAWDRNWPMTECQGDSTEALFPRHQPQVGHLMTRIRLNCWRSKYTLATCLCLQESISLHHCLFDCPTLQTISSP